MNVGELISLLDACNKESEILIRTDIDEAFFINDVIDDEGYVEILLEGVEIKWR